MRLNHKGSGVALETQFITWAGCKGINSWWWDRESVLQAIQVASDKTIQCRRFPKEKVPIGVEFSALCRAQGSVRWGHKLGSETGSRITSQKVLGAFPTVIRGLTM